MDELRWTTEYPTEPGYYWARNLKWEDERDDEVKSTWETCIVEICNFDSRVPGLEFFLIGSEIPRYQDGVISGEWYGPIEPPA